VATLLDLLNHALESELLTDEPCDDAPGLHHRRVCTAEAPEEQQVSQSVLHLLLEGLVLYVVAPRELQLEHEDSKDLLASRLLSSTEGVEAGENLLEEEHHPDLLSPSLALRLQESGFNVVVNNNVSLCSEFVPLEAILIGVNSLPLDSQFLALLGSLNTLISLDKARHRVKLLRLIEGFNALNVFFDFVNLINVFVQ